MPRGQTWKWVMVVVAWSPRKRKVEAEPTATIDDPQASFERFYDAELAGQVRRAALLMGDQQEARDLVHDAFIEIFVRWDQLTDPGPYLNRVVLNRCRDRARSLARRGGPPEVLTDVRLSEDTFADDQLWGSLHRLPFNHRAALVLRYHYELTTDEIAAALGCRPGSVGPWIDRGLRQLRTELR